jgi:hypothetical protein
MMADELNIYMETVAGPSIAFAAVNVTNLTKNK